WIVNIFFFQAEDGIRDRNVTGVQTCALPISTTPGWYLGRGAISNGDVLTLEPGGRALEVTAKVWIPIRAGADYLVQVDYREAPKIGRASCRERVEVAEVDGREEDKIILVQE